MPVYRRISNVRQKVPAKPYEVKEVYFAAEKEAVKPQLINPYA